MLVLSSYIGTLESKILLAYQAHHLCTRQILKVKRWHNLAPIELTIPDVWKKNIYYHDRQKVWSFIRPHEVYLKEKFAHSHRDHNHKEIAHMLLLFFYIHMQISIFDEKKGCNTGTSQEVTRKSEFLKETKRITY